MLRHHENNHLFAALPEAELPSASGSPKGWTHYQGGYFLTINPGVSCGLRVSRKLGSPENGIQRR